MLPAGITITVSGQDKPSLFLLPIQDGYTSLLTLFHSTMSFQDSKDNSLEILTLSVMMKAHLITGSMRAMIKKYGCFLRRCGDGSDGKMVPMYFLLTSQKQDGIISQIVDLMLSKILDKVSTTQSMSTTTTFIQMCMNNPELLEEFREPELVNSLRKANSMTKADGEVVEKKLA